MYFERLAAALLRKSPMKLENVVMSQEWVAPLQTAASFLQTATKSLEKKIQTWASETASASPGATTLTTPGATTLATSKASSGVTSSEATSLATSGAAPTPPRRTRRRARAYDPSAPPRSTPRQELNAFFNLITQGTDKPTSTVYDEIIQKEDRTLRLMDRLVTDDIQRRQTDTLFVSTPLARIPLHMVRTLQHILDDLLSLRGSSWRDVLAIFTKDQRATYLGMWFLLIAIVLLLLENSRP